MRAGDRAVTTYTRSRGASCFKNAPIESAAWKTASLYKAMTSAIHFARQHVNFARQHKLIGSRVQPSREDTMMVGGASFRRIAPSVSASSRFSSTIRVIAPLTLLHCRLSTLLRSRPQGPTEASPSTLPTKSAGRGSTARLPCHWAT